MINYGLYIIIIYRARYVVGRQFKGEYLRFIQPCLALKVGQRRNLELTAPSLEDSPREREKYVIEFD
jgi:hypothetical protein